MSSVRKLSENKIDSCHKNVQQDSIQSKCNNTSDMGYNRSFQLFMPCFNSMGSRLPVTHKMLLSLTNSRMLWRFTSRKIKVLSMPHCVVVVVVVLLPTKTRLKATKKNKKRIQSTEYCTVITLHTRSKQLVLSIQYHTFKLVTIV